MEPAAEKMSLPAGYGTPEKPLDWATVHQRIADSDRVWLATTRPDGRPHVVPVDGLWLEGSWYFGGSPETVHMRNLRENPSVVIHLGDVMSVVIAEGRAELVTPPSARANALVAASKQKYGYAPPAQAYQAGVWCLTPTRILAWQSFPQDVTRFRFS
jgi:nitroimidazol reductase NimA-like FMN-containing flavoprotein (pyridoxamine 5'-phosphate oxidase superfamily)